MDPRQAAHEHRRPLLAHLADIAHNTEDRARAAQALAAWQQAEGQHQTTANMADAYWTLYSEILAARRAFQTN